ncbi:hypothetical protein EDL99_02680 [Ornithobacterium rhinotracheale]|nr:hypothetical protein [Ornithobacterium rhinotracheale]
MNKQNLFLLKNIISETNFFNFMEKINEEDFFNLREDESFERLWLEILKRITNEIQKYRTSNYRI